MKAKHHFWSSALAGGGLYLVTGSSAAIAGAMVGGFLIDADHVLDQMWSIYRGAPFMRRPKANDSDRAPGGFKGLYKRFVRRRKLVRLPLIFHSYELFAVLVLLSVFAPTPFRTGLVAGYALHIALDFIRHRHEFRSPFFYSIS
ncbi:MAG TPA: hypothetical protein VJQ56_04460, partial [Blastocatellia bacterium]|nr:hypothetical protein [Blastocatellia bacterium]